MAASMKLKAAGILAASGIIALAYIYEPVSSTCGAYDSVVKAAAGIFVIAGSALFSNVVGQTFLKNRGRGTFKALYFASLSSVGVGVAVSASAVMPMNVNAALFVLSLAFAIAGVCMLRFLQAGGA
jgi:uncharacterized membrane-anchored protein